jgi:hypothetical protein
LVASLVLSVAGLSAAIVCVVITAVLVLLTWLAPAEAVRARVGHGGGMTQRADGGGLWTHYRWRAASSGLLLVLRRADGA